MHSDDVCALIDFRKAKYPGVDKCFRGLDFSSVQTIVEGLVAYGWTYEELSKCRSSLMEQVFLYVDQEQLARGQVQSLDSDLGRKRRRDSSPIDLSNHPDAQRLHQNPGRFNTMNLVIPVNNDTDGTQSLLGATGHVVQPSMVMETHSHPEQSSSATATSYYPEGASIHELTISSATSRGLSIPETRDRLGKFFLA